MPTTLTIDDELARQLMRIVRDSGKPFETVVDEALRAGIDKLRTAKAAKSYRLKPVAVGDVQGPYDLDKTLQLWDQLEDDAITLRLLPNSLTAGRPKANSC